MANIPLVIQKDMDRNHFWQKLKAVIAANFGSEDLVVTLFYRDEMRPKCWKDAEDQLMHFVCLLEADRRAAGQTLSYLCATDESRFCPLHHHLIVTSAGGTCEAIRRLWGRNGDYIDIQTIATKGYDGWARYLSKAPYALDPPPVGELMWHGSLGLKMVGDPSG